MSSRRRWAATLATGVVLLAAPGVASAKSDVADQAWTRTGVVPTFVPEEDVLYVAADAGVEQARAFVSIATSALDGVQDGVLTLVEADAPIAATEPALGACPLTSPLVASGELSADAAPTADCATPVALGRGDAGTWTLELGALLALAAPEAASFGIALVPDVAGGATFHVAFDPEATELALETAAEETAGAGLDDAPVAPADSGPAPAAPPPLPVEVAPDLALERSGEAGAPAADEAPVAAVRSATPIALGAGGPSALVVVGLVAVASCVPGVRLGRRNAQRARGMDATQGSVVAPDAARTVTRAALLAVGLAMPLAWSEANVYKLGLVLIVFVGGIGLHLLVNWAGELSLAHATMIGLPAFAVAKLSADHGVSPILLLPIGVAIGAVAGAVVGLPAIRARGLQVALVTLAGGIAIDRFFFTKTWLVGPAAGATVEVPTLGPFRFDTARSLYGVLVACVAVAVGVAWLLHRSKLARGMLWVKADPAAAAAFGIPVAHYRALAYVMAGAFAGFSGALTAMWVQRLTPQAFPLDRSFTYLTIVVLAGRGFVGGVAVAALAIEGGRLFLANGDAFMVYAGPIGLLLTLVTNRDGLNGLTRRVAAGARAVVAAGAAGTRKEPTMDVEPTRSHSLPVRPLTVAGVVTIAMGFAAIAVAWYHAGNTDQVWVQNQELISGGVGGLALVVLGVGLLIYDRVAVERAVVVERWERLLEAIATRDERPVTAAASDRPLRARARVQAR